MATPNPTWPLLCAAIFSGLLFTGSTPSSSSARTGSTLAGTAKASRSEPSALLQLYAAESALARAQAAQAALEARSTSLARAEAQARLETEVVRRSLHASERRVAALLRDLYIEGEPDPIAVILGATSIEEVVAGIDGLTRATAQNQRLAHEAAQKAEELDVLRAGLAGRRASLDSARAAAGAGTRQLATAVAEQQQTVAAVRRANALSEQRVATLRSQAHEAQVSVDSTLGLGTRFVISFPRKTFENQRPAPENRV